MASGPLWKRILDRRIEHIVLGVMLLALYVVLRSGPGTALAASFMAVHLGLAFIWQPIWQREQKLDVGSLVFVVTFCALFIAALNWWALFAWLIVLIGIVAGRTITTLSERIAYMIALAYLVSELLVTCVPALFQVRNLAPNAVELFRLGLLLLPCVLAFIPGRRDASPSAFDIDFVRTINFALITASLAFGSVALTFNTALDYPVALFLTLLALAGFLLFIGWLLNPRGTAGNLFQLWERSLLNIGTPFEQWLTRLASTSEAHEDPDQFLANAVEQMIDIPFVTGVHWRAGDAEGRVGVDGNHHYDYSTPDLSLVLHTRRPVGPTLLLHYKLLTQLIWHFYSARLRAHEHAEQAHLQAIHSTGARLTHDIKNLLQSLNTLTGELMQMPEQSSDPATTERRRRGEALLRRQLPHISQRLQLALDKLRTPEPGPVLMVPVRTWWSHLHQRTFDPRIRLRDMIGPEVEIPQECFDSVLDNLLENALYKATLDDSVTIVVTMTTDVHGARLEVCDSGVAVPDDTASHLFKHAVDSAAGLGVGLYQAGRLAELAGYRLNLRSNEPGRVCFRLQTIAAFNTDCGK
ncbi:MAG: hypothetical protein H6978_11735 [Gammaproteobacteria bacterium]|nr:hypothetical protein [Gammaproteobacteria bacterium]